MNDFPENVSFSFALIQQVSAKPESFTSEAFSLPFWNDSSQLQNDFINYLNCILFSILPKMKPHRCNYNNYVKSSLDEWQTAQNANYSLARIHLHDTLFICTLPDRWKREFLCTCLTKNDKKKQSKIMITHTEQKETQTELCYRFYYHKLNRVGGIHVQLIV